tara:strand:- start:442 stop:645 length:204 start_codon:yes stop_codon:yes gene_type:complete
MMNFYQVTCQHVTDDGNGKMKKVTERYLINAVSVTDAEAITTREYGMNVSDFEVKEVKKSRIIDVTI